VKTAVLTGILAALALATATSGGEAARPDTTIVPDGGCVVCRFFDYSGYGTLSLTAPVNRCGSVFPSGSQANACAGWSYWDRTRVWKAGGGWIRVGFWYRPPGALPAMAYRIFGSGWNGSVATVDRTEIGAPPYIASTCAYDYVYGGPASSVLCEAIDW
jgi:hypothetical protein